MHRGWPQDIDRHIKNRDSLGPGDQERLARAHVLVAGAGGLGGYVIELLARIGVGQLTVVDGDRFEPSNLNRQLLCLEDNLGSPKAEAARERVARIDPGVVCRTVPEFLDRKGFCQHIAGVSLVVDALGGISSHRELCAACLGRQKPLVTGAIAGWTGFAATVLPGGPDPGFLWQTDNGKDAEGILGSLAPMAAAIAAVQCAEAVACLTGEQPCLSGKLLVVDLRQGSFETVEL
ncbi:HesA/MoeB/ThiF family protein [Desulfoplanes sp.]